MVIIIYLIVSLIGIIVLELVRLRLSDKHDSELDSIVLSILGGLMWPLTICIIIGLVVEFLMKDYDNNF